MPRNLLPRVNWHLFSPVVSEVFKALRKEDPCERRFSVRLWLRKKHWTLHAEYLPRGRAFNVSAALSPLFQFLNKCIHMSPTHYHLSAKICNKVSITRSNVNEILLYKKLNQYRTTSSFHTRFFKIKYHWQIIISETFTLKVYCFTFIDYQWTFTKASEIKNKKRLRNKKESHTIG